MTLKSTTIEEKRYRKIIEKNCDICGIRISNMFPNVEVSLEFANFVAYPDCNCGEVYTSDCCPECYKKIVAPKLRELGLKIYLRDADDCADERKEYKGDSFEDAHDYFASWGTSDESLR